MGEATGDAIAVSCWRTSVRFHTSDPNPTGTKTIEVRPASPAMGGVRRLFTFLRENLLARWRGGRTADDATESVCASPASFTIGTWRVLEALGEGASARVFRVTPANGASHTHPQYALKLMSQRQARDRMARSRFLRESRVLKSVQHRNIVRLVDTGEHEDCPYLVMEMVEGFDLRTAIVENQPRLKGKLDWAIQLCRGLAAVHARGIVHRDLKPENILTTRDGFIKVADFGLARICGGTVVTRVGHLVGTPAYMAPEYLLGQEPDCRSDLYSLGVILYEMFTGKMPYQAETVNDYIHAHLDAKPTDPTSYAPEMPRELGAIILRLLDKRPDRRFSSAGDLRIALDGLLSQLAGLASPEQRCVA